MVTNFLGEGIVPDPPERERLPFFKDPKIKFSVWAIIKDSIGKDLTRITLPVYLSMPLSALQMQSSTSEYIGLLDKAIFETDPVKRLAIVTAFSMVQFNGYEKCSSKPFNPMLGETFEYENDKYRILAELAVHHPPVVAIFTEGKSGFRKYTTMRPKPKFVRGTI